jgi:predicted transposase/invertase (TIGR01784 family)
MPAIGIKPTVDVVFKKLFGSPEHAGLTLSFVNSILHLAGKPLAASLEIVNPFRLAEFQGDKEIIVDVRARDPEGREFQVEMQIRKEPDLADRMLDTWARVFTAQVRKGERYGRHHPLIAIWVLERQVFTDESWFHSFSIQDPAHGIELSASFSILCVELGKRAALPDFGEDAILKSGIDEWLYLLAKGESLDPEAGMLRGAEKEIQEAVEVMSAFTKQEKARYTYEKRLEWERVMAGMKEDAQAEGLAEGLAQGLAQGKIEGSREQALVDARRFKALGVDLDIVAQGTGLSREEVEAL